MAGPRWVGLNFLIGTWCNLAALGGGFSLNMGQLICWEDLKGIHGLGTANKKAIKVPWPRLAWQIFFIFCHDTSFQAHSSSFASVTLSILHLSKKRINICKQYFWLTFLSPNLHKFFKHSLHNICAKSPSIFAIFFFFFG